MAANSSYTNSTSSWACHFEGVLAAQKARIQKLERRLRHRGLTSYQQLATVPRGSTDHLLFQSVDILMKGHQLCQQTLRQIEQSKARLANPLTEP
jgi:hypothetical protein